jgi:hypothetical protein
MSRSILKHAGRIHKSFAVTCAGCGAHASLGTGNEIQARINATSLGWAKIRDQFHCASCWVEYTQNKPVAMLGKEVPK